MIHPIYTVGYSAWTVPQLQAEVVRLGALLVDIRYSPTSMRPDWRRESLRTAFGAAYQHQPALGNRAYKEGTITLAAPECAVGPLGAVLAEQPIILLCACRDWQTCHRTVAANYLAEQLGAPMVHLDPPAPAMRAGAVPCLTLQQPWAWALFFLPLAVRKDIENRPWPTRFRGRLHIHTSQRVPRRQFADDCAMIHALTGIQPPCYEAMDHGKVIGSVSITDCVTESDSVWFFGPYGLVVADAVPLSMPVAAKGALGIWQWTSPLGGMPPA